MFNIILRSFIFDKDQLKVVLVLTFFNVLTVLQVGMTRNWYVTLAFISMYFVAAFVGNIRYNYVESLEKK